MNDQDVSYNRGVVRPIQCLKDGWQLIKQDYWLFLGLELVGVLIGSIAPLGLLMGPMMCGIYLCHLRRMDDRSVTFNHLFQGFNHFGPSFVAHLFMLVPTMVLLVLFYAGMFGSMFALLQPQQQQQGQPPDPAAVYTFLGVLAGLMLVFMVALMLLSALFVFAFPLIVDRQLSAFAAVKTSIGAVFANLGGILGLMFLQGLLGLAGALLCYVGVIFVLPITFASTAIAYRAVFASDQPADELDEREPAEAAELDAPETPPDDGLQEGFPH